MGGAAGCRVKMLRCASLPKGNLSLRGKFEARGVWIKLGFVEWERLTVKYGEST